jgi:hypothetical protein
MDPYAQATGPGRSPAQSETSRPRPRARGREPPPPRRLERASDRAPRGDRRGVQHPRPRPHRERRDEADLRARRGAAQLRLPLRLRDPGLVLAAHTHPRPLPERISLKAHRHSVMDARSASARPSSSTASTSGRRPRRPPGALVRLQYETETCLSVPLLTANFVVGVLNLADKRRRLRLPETGRARRRAARSSARDGDPQLQALPRDPEPGRRRTRSPGCGTTAPSTRPCGRKCTARSATADRSGWSCSTSTRSRSSTTASATRRETPPSPSWAR